MVCSHHKLTNNSDRATDAGGHSNCNGPECEIGSLFTANCRGIATKCKNCPHKFCDYHGKSNAVVTDAIGVCTPTPAPLDFATTMYVGRSCGQHQRSRSAGENLARRAAVVAAAARRWFGTPCYKDLARFPGEPACLMFSSTHAHGPAVDDVPDPELRHRGLDLEAGDALTLWLTSSFRARTQCAEARWAQLQDHCRQRHRSPRGQRRRKRG